MKVFKKAALMICALIVLSSIAACTPYNEKRNDLDTLQFYSNYKKDKNVPFGKKVAVSDNKVYYLSDEDFGQGVYTMDTDGENVTKLFDCKDIRKIQITEKAIFLSIYAGVEQNNNGKYRSFRLTKVDLKTSECEDILSKIEYKHIRDDLKQNIWDFYYLYDDNIIIVDSLKESIQARLMNVTYGISPNGELDNESYDYLLERVTDQQMKKYASVSFLSLGNLKLCSDKLPNEIRYNKQYKQPLTPSQYEYIYTYVLTLEKDLSAIDTVSNIKVLGGAHINDDAFDGGRNYVMHSLNPRGIIMTIDGQIILFDEKTKSLTSQVVVPDVTRILFLYDMGDTAYIIGEKENGAQGVYFLDLETFKISTIKEFHRTLFSPDEKVLWLDMGKVVTAKDNTIIIWNIYDENTLTINKEIELPQSIVSKEYKTDVAGDWLFVYRFDETKNYDVLQYKINLLNYKIS